MRKLTLTFVLFITACSQALAATTADYLMPMAVERGRDVEVILHGNRLQNIEQVLFWDEGITFLGSEPVSEVRDLHQEKMNPAREGTAARLKFRIAEECRLGRHYFRIRTDETLSELQSLWVTPYPCVEESQPFSDHEKRTNGDFEHAQSVELGTTVYGYSLLYRLQDHDFFRVEMEAGQRLTVELWSDCLNFFRTDCTSDYAVAVYGPDRKRLAFSDNTALTRRDPWLSLAVPKSGTYYIDIHKSVEAEHMPWHYIANITGGVRPALTYPLGGEAGTTLAMQLLGGGADREAKVPLPKRPGRFEESMIEYRAGEAVLPNRIQVAEFPNVLEDGKAHFTPDNAQVYDGQLPIAFNGIIENEGKLDWFRFTTRKGERYRIRSYSARLGSPLDPIMTIQPAPGTESKINVTVDDSKFHMHDLADNKNLAHSMKMDPVMIFEPDVDGDFLLGIGDSQFLAGPHHVYRVEIQPVTDQAFLRVTRDYREVPAKREAFVIPRGNTMERTMQFLIPAGSRYRGEVEFIAEGLPPGVTMECAPAKVGSGWVQLIFTADKNTKPWAGFIDLKMRPTDPAAEFTGEYLFHRVSDGGRGGYGDSFYLYRKCPLAVVEPAPFAVRVLEPKVPLMKKASLEVEVEVERRDGFSGPVRLTCYWTPYGVAAGAPVDLTAEESRATFALSADDRAEVGSFPLSITVQQALDETPDERGARKNGYGTGYHYVASPPVHVQVAEPYLDITFERTALAQETTGELVAAITELRPLPGTAQAKLLLLPPGMEAKGSAVKIQPGDKTVRFPVKVTRDCLVGQYENITCEIAVEVGGQLIKQTSGNAVIRIDEEKK